MAEEDKDIEIEEQETPNPLEMSDEDILNMAPDSFESNIEDSNDAEKEEEPEEEVKEEVKEEVVAKDNTFTDEGSEEHTEEVSQEASDKEEETSTDESLEKSSEIDYKGEYSKLLAPFTASGKEHQVKNVDEAVRLMQFGVDYHKKAATLKGIKRQIKPLEDNNLLNDDSISLFIDLLVKKDQNALKKIISDFGLDPVDIDIDDSSVYKPNTYTVDDSQLELDDVLEDLKSSSHYTNILDIVGNKWDEKSKHTVAKQPNIMRDLNKHIESGVYTQVVKEVERQRMFGNLNGMSDIEAYNAVGAQLAQQGSLQGQSAPLQPPQVPNASQPVKNQTQNSPELNSKRKAAATTKSMPSGQKAPKANPLGMSDEDFMKAGF